jgi:hypothetical protein
VGRNPARGLRIVAMAFLGFAMPVAADSFTVALSPPEQSIRSGDTPRFEVVVKTAEPARVLDVVRRGDLRDKLVKPMLSGGDLDDLPVSLLPLGPVGDADYLDLKSGETIRFEFDGLPLVLNKLGPGSYKLVVQYRADWGSRPVQSNPVTLQVAQ